MDDRVLVALRERGFVPGEVLGAGMEGTVVDLSGGFVGKIWHARPRDALAELVEFGRAVDAASIPFTVSGSIDFLELDGVFVTIERRVDGVPLRLGDQRDPPPVSELEARLMGDALEGLSQAIDPRLSSLPMLPGEPPFEGGEPFGRSLAALVDRRYRRTAALFRTAVPGLDQLVPALVERLRAMPPTRTSLIHGDLIPANVLVRDDNVAGVVDFGFLSTLGDPQFDAAITASVFDMYGAHAETSREILDAHFLQRFRHDPQAYALYRAAYAVITHAAYGTDGTDGHFSWCAQVLRRPDVTQAITR